MGDTGDRRRAAPKRTLIAPLLMLAGGVVTSALVWRLLMLEPLPPQNPHALERVPGGHGRP